MRDFTKEEKDKIINTPISLECFDMVDSFSDYGDEGLIELESLYSVWYVLTTTLENLRCKYLETKNENYFIELARLMPVNSYKFN